VYIWGNFNLWDDDRFSGFGISGSSSSRRIRGKWNRIRIAKLAIKVGFVIVAIVFLSVFIPHYGLNTEIIQRSEGVGAIQTISIKLSNNNFETVMILLLKPRTWISTR
jgi:hypothetical protein